MKLKHVNAVCPYDGSHRNTGLIENKNQRLFAVCNHCHRSARVVVYRHADNTEGAELRQVGRKPIPHPKKLYQIRLSDLDVRSLQIGSAVLTISNNRIQLLYKT